MTNKIIGKYGEDLACDFLTKKGYEILERNFRFSKLAEIDIIAHKKDVLHFVEVKTRTQKFFGSPQEAVTPSKLKQIYSCAMFYLQNSKKKYKSYQIDVIGIELNKNEIKEINFIERNKKKKCDSNKEI